MNYTPILIALFFPAAALAQEPPKPLVVERVIDAPVERVWASFTDTAAVTSWMAPNAKVDLRIGGSIKTNYDRKGKIGDRNTIVNKILSYEPHRMLSLQTVKAPANFPFAKGTLGTWSVTYFTPLGKTRTRVRVVTLGWRSGPEGEKAYAFFKRGNAYTLALLAKHLAGKRTQSPKTDGSDVPKKR